jgi:deoxyribose-phosphate aldolase
MSDPKHRSLSGADLRNLVQQTVHRLRAEGELSGDNPGGLLPTVSSRGRATITVDDIDAVSGSRMQVPANALITPAAQDRAREKGIQISSAPSAAGDHPLGPQEEALVARLSTQLAADMGSQAPGEMSCWCRTDCLTKCADRVAIVANAGADRIGLDVATPPSSDAIARLIDHTVLKPQASEADIVRICREAVDYGFASVCVNPYYVPLVADMVRGSQVLTCAVVGFPLGANMPETKALETSRAVADGAQEIDMVVNVGALKSARYDWVRHDIEAVVAAAHAGGAIVKVILETALLSDEEKIIACEIARDAGAEFVKTSTGFGPGGATTDDVALMRRVVGAQMGVKATGGIGSRQDAAAMIAAGATRIGASAGVRITREL